MFASFQKNEIRGVILFPLNSNVYISFKINNRSESYMILRNSPKETNYISSKVWRKISLPNDYIYSKMI